jgi:PleD family two-component response regulator
VTSIGAAGGRVAASRMTSFTADRALYKAKETGRNRAETLSGIN